MNNLYAISSFVKIRLGRILSLLKIIQQAYNTLLVKGTLTLLCYLDLAESVS